MVTLVVASVWQLTAPLQSTLPCESTTGLDGSIVTSWLSGAAEGSALGSTVTDPRLGCSSEPPASVSSVVAAEPAEPASKATRNGELGAPSLASGPSGPFSREASSALSLTPSPMASTSDEASLVKTASGPPKLAWM